jgi:amino acid transporter/nucleotide-binding universal stress UspA family protein
MAEPPLPGVEVRLSRDLGLLDVTMIGVGAMIGAGIFVLTGIAAGLAGPGLILAFLLNGAVTIFTAMSYAELGSTFPEAGGGYMWVKEALPHPFGFMSGWMSWFGHTVACAVYALGFAAFFLALLTEYGVVLGVLGPASAVTVVAMLVTLAFVAINYAGVSSTGRMESVIAMAKIVILVALIAFAGVAMFRNPNFFASFEPFFPNGIDGVFFAMGLTFIAFQGYEIIAQAGEEVKDPRRSIPRAIFISLAVVIVIYVVIAVVSLGALTPEDGREPWEILGEQRELAIVEIARRFIPGFGFLLIILGGLLSTTSALNATIFSSSRVSFAMGRDGALPRAFGRIHRKFRVPHLAIVMTGLVIGVMVLFPIESVALSADVMFLLMFFLVNVALIRLRKLRPDADRGYKVPLFPYVPLAGIVMQLFLAVYLFNYVSVNLETGELFEAGRFSWTVAGLWIGLGLLTYFFYRGRREIVEIPEKKRVELYEVLGAPEAKVELARYRVFLPLREFRDVKLVEFGSWIARARGGELSFLNVVELPRTLPAKAIRFSYVDERIRGLQKLEKAAKKHAVDVRSVVRIGHRPYDIILDAIVEEDVDLLLMGWRGEMPKGERRILGSNIDYLVQRAPCDVAVLRTRGMKDRLARILLISGGTSHVIGAAKLAAIAAKVHGATVTVLRIRQPGRPEAEDRGRDMIAILRGEGVPVDERTVTARSVFAAAVKASADYDLLVLGASTRWVVKRYAFGPLEDRIARYARCPVLMYRRAVRQRLPPG